MSVRMVARRGHEAAIRRSVVGPTLDSAASIEVVICALPLPVLASERIGGQQLKLPRQPVATKGSSHQSRGRAGWSTVDPIDTLPASGFTGLVRSVECLFPDLESSRCFDPYRSPGSSPP